MTVGADRRRTTRRGAACPRPSAPCAEMSRRRRAARATQASIHGQMPQAGFFGVQIVAPRSIIAWVKSPARRCGTSVSARRADFRLGRRQFGSRRHKAARSPARCCRRSPPRAGRTRSPRSPPRYSRRCRAARAAPSSVSGNRPPCCAGHRLRAGMQVARAGVIAEPGPGLEHVVERRRGQRVDIRPARQEFRVIRPDRLDGGLLQHDLGQPDVIGIGPLARRASATADGGDAGRTRRAARRDRAPRPHAAASRFFRTAAPATLMMHRF